MNNTLKASRLLIALLSPFVTISTAQADSLDEWAYWNASPQFSPKGFQFVYNSNPNPTTAEQTRTGTNQGNLVEATGTDTQLSWVGYSLGGYVSGSTYASSANKIGEFQLEPVNVDGTVDDSLKLQGQLANVPVLLNLTGTGDENVKLNFHASGPGSFSVYSSTLNIGEGGGTINDGDREFIGDNILDIFSAPYEPGVFRDYLGGRVVFGLPMPLNNIAAAVAAAGPGNLIYSFNGRSALGSSVSIDVNFAQASWNGDFGAGGSTFEGTGHYGYTAVGTVSGNTLTSTIVTGNSGSPTVGMGMGEGPALLVYEPPRGTVTSGQVTGRLVGELGLNDIGKAGIIGKSELTVMPATRVEPELTVMPATRVEARVAEPATATPVNDIFMLGAELKRSVN